MIQGSYLLQLLPKYLLTFIFMLVAGGGILSATLQPPFFAPDEPWHWQTAWFRFETLRSAETRVCSKALGLPDLFGVEHVKFNYQESMPSRTIKNAESSRPFCMPADRDPLNYGNILSYPGVNFARILLKGESSSTEMAIRTFFDSRFFQLIITIGVISRFIFLSLLHFSKFGRWLFGTLTIGVVTTTPIFLQQASAISSDSMVNALSLCLAMVIMFWPLLGYLDALLLAFVGSSAAATKPIILPILVCTLIVIYLKSFWVQKKFEILHLGNVTLLHKNFTKPQLGILFLLAMLSIFATYIGLSASATLSKGVGNPSAQLRFVFDFPIRTLSAIWEGAIRHLNFNHFLGNLGWLDTPLQGNLVHAYKVFFYSAVILDLFFMTLSNTLLPKIHPLSAVRGISSFLFILLGALATNALTAFALFLTWSPIGSERVDGLQPRYFLFSFIAILVGANQLTTIFFNEISESELTQHSAQTNNFMLNLIQSCIGLILIIVFSQTLSQIAFTYAKRYW